MCIRDRILCAVRHGYLLQPSWSAATLPPSRPDGLEESLEASARSLAPRVPVLTGVSPQRRLQSAARVVARWAEMGGGAGEHRHPRGKASSGGFQGLLETVG